MHLSDFNHLRSNSMVKFKEELVEGISYTIIAYMISDKDYWKIPLSLETRGITFETETGRCVCRPFSKFFNVGEREETNLNFVVNHFIESYEKKDGSLVTPILTSNNHIIFKTKKSFYSDVANLANENASESIKHFSKWCLKMGITPCFEFTHPDCRIVLDYGTNPQFTLLACRSIISGHYLEYDQMKGLINNLDLQIPMINRYSLTWDEIQERVESSKGIEGYVLKLDNEELVKIKTQWYLSVHRVMTDLRWRDIAEAIIDETIDDIKSLISSQGFSLEKIELVEMQITNELAHIRKLVETIVMAAKFKGKSIKEVAIQLKEHPLFSLIMTAMRDKDPDYTEYWRRNFLKDYSLRIAYNPNF